jgi:DNA-binding CsgD family transcriptional regulator
MIYEFHGVKLDPINEASDENPRQTKPKLTEKQHMILFFYINKYSNTEIANVLTSLGYQISSGRVNEHLAKIKYIFGVRTKEELVDIAIKLNYHLFIPRKLLKVGTYLLDDELIICEN